MRPLAWIFLLLFSFARIGGPVEDPKTPWTPEDYISAETASDFEISPDGTQVVWTKTTVDEEGQKRHSQLQLTDLADGETIPLTQGDHDASGAEWSPDGKLIAFLTDRPDPKAKGEDPEGPQIWLIRARGGEAWPLTNRERGVQRFDWAGNESIICIAAESKSNYEKELEERKDTSALVDDEAHEPPVRLFGVDVESGEMVRLSKNNDWIDGIWVSPDGRWAVTSHERSLRYGYDQKIGPHVFLWNLEDETSDRILSDFRSGIGQVQWQPDAKGFYFAADHSTHPLYVMASESRLYHFELGNKKVTSIPLQTGRGLLFGTLRAHPEGVLALLENGAKSSLALFAKTATGWQKQDLKGPHAQNTWGLEVSRDGKRIVYAYSTASLPEQYLAARLEGGKLVDEKPITHLNPEWEDRATAKSEAIRWKGAKDEEVEGILYYPNDYAAGKRYPLVLMIHGGPLGHDADTWNDGWGDPVQLFTQRGAFVLKPNYHGSSGYGLAFAESIAAGNYYTLPVEDIEKGVSHLIAKGLVDPEKLSTMGWSNGAILSVALIAKDPRYKAASVGAGGADWTSDWGVCAFGQAFSNYYLGKAPIEDPELYRRNAPIYDFDKIRTPTIFLHGTEDTSVPTFHSLSMYRTLQYLGKVDTRLVMFPGEPHGIQKPAHRLRKLKEEVAWFDRYLFHPEVKAASNESLREGSMLAELIELAKAKRVERRYGQLSDGVLIPETVAFRGLQVARFEVTQAQYAAFDPNYTFPVGRENWPAHGVAFDRAKAYAQWLSQKTGRSYRLPNVKEADSLYADGAQGNTLDNWAGYSVNPDDALRLRELVKTLEGRAPLVREVGRFGGQGKADKVYDLGGNVAEWVELASGEGAPLGGSADVPEDPSTDLEPGPDYVGFRIVLAANSK